MSSARRAVMSRPRGRGRSGLLRGHVAVVLQDAVDGDDARAHALAHLRPLLGHLRALEAGIARLWELVSWGSGYVIGAGGES